MYEELVKGLRDCPDYINGCKQCRYEHSLMCRSLFMSEAADAIEELQKVANKLLAKYQEEATGMIWEYSGHIEKSLALLEKEVTALQAQIDGKPEPPDENEV